MKHICKLISILFIIVLLPSIGIATAYPGANYTTESTTPIVRLPDYDRGVIITTDKQTYNIGENVKINIYNRLNQPIYFHEIFMEYPPKTISNTCAGETCPDVNVETIKVNPRQKYTYPYTWNPGKGTYRVYINWWAEGTVTCMAIGCPKPEPALSGKAVSKYFNVR